MTDIIIKQLYRINRIKVIEYYYSNDEAKGDGGEEQFPDTI